MPATQTAPAARIFHTITSHKTGVSAAATITTADIRVGTFSLVVTTTVGARAPRTGRFLCGTSGVRYLGGERTVTLPGGHLDTVNLEGEALAEVTSAAAYMWAELKAAALAGRKAAIAGKQAELESEGDIDGAGKLAGWLHAA